MFIFFKCLRNLLAYTPVLQYVRDGVHELCMQIAKNCNEFAVTQVFLRLTFKAIFVSS